MMRNKYHERDPLWHVQIFVLIMIFLQLILSNSFSITSKVILVLCELLLLVALSFTTPKSRVFESAGRRINVILLIVLVSLANSYSLFIVLQKLLQTGTIQNGSALILAAINIYLTNIIIFGLLYWEMDAGGPGHRQAAEPHEHDFLFPQNQNESYKHPKWQPTFMDYLYVSSTNGMAFSPTDTLPLSRRAKVLMLVQATISLVTIALVAARAINILH